MGSLYPTLSQVIVSYLALGIYVHSVWIYSKMGVLHSIPLCSRGSGANQVEPLDLDKNNNEASVVFTSQPQPIAPLNFPPHNVVDFQNFEKERTRLKDTVLINSNLRVVVATEAPEATSTPRPQSPTGLANEQYSDSSQMASEAEDDSEAAAEEPPALSDSGLEESATEFEFSRPSPPTLTIDEDSLDGLEAIGLEDQNDGHEEIDLNEIEEPQERPPEPTVPDERVDQSSSDEEESSQPQERPQGQPQGQSQGDFLGDFLNAHPQGHPQGQSQLKDETSREISSLLSELVGDRPAGEAMHRPDLVPMR